MPAVAQFQNLTGGPMPGLPQLLAETRVTTTSEASRYVMTVQTGPYTGYEIAAFGTDFLYREGEPLLGAFSRIEVADASGTVFVTYRWTDGAGNEVSSGRDITELRAGNVYAVAVDSVIGSDGVETLAKVRATGDIDLGGGNDFISDSFAASVYGGAGDDSFDKFGAAGGANVLYGGDGADVFARIQNILVHGGEGDDAIRFDGASNGVGGTAWGDGGDDVIAGRFTSAYGGDGNDILAPTAQYDDGFDLITVLADGGAGEDVLFFANSGSYINRDGERQQYTYSVEPVGIETVEIEDNPRYPQVIQFRGLGTEAYYTPSETMAVRAAGDTPVETSLAVYVERLATDLDVSGWTFSGLDLTLNWFVNGTEAGRSFTTTDVADTVALHDAAGTDSALFTGAGDDLVNGWTTDAVWSRIDLGDGDDTVVLRYGQQATVDGGAGLDILRYYFRYNAPRQDMVVDLSTNTAPNVVFTSIEGVVTGTGNDSILGSAGDDYIDPGTGNDTVDGGAGFDTINVHSAHEIILTDDGRGLVRSSDGAVQRRFDNFEAVEIDARPVPRRAAVEGTTFYGNAFDNGYTARAGDEVYGGGGTDWATLDFTLDRARLFATEDGQIIIDSAVPPNEGDAYIRPARIVIHDDVETLRFTDATLTYQQVRDQVRGADIVGTREDDELDGSYLSEAIYGGRGDDTLRGLGGNDTLYGAEGKNLLDGGEGDDRMEGGPGNATYISTTGSDALIGSAAFDLANFAYRAEAVSIDLAAGTGASGDDLLTLSEIDNVVGSAFGDGLAGDGAANNLYGGAGDDTLEGRGGDDLLYGGTGEDSVVFGVAHDAVETELSGDDLWIRSSEGADLVGGDVELFVFADRTLTRDEVRTGSVVPITGTDQSELIEGTTGDDVILGFGGNDWINANGGSDSIDGGDGRDMVSFVGLADLPGRGNGYRLVIDLGDGVAASPDGTERTVMTSVERVTGTIFADFITGSAGDDEMRGLGDYDWFIATAGADSYDGGSGRDMVSYVDAEAGVVLSLATGGRGGIAAGDRYASVERVTGSSFADLFYGDAEVNDFRGLGGADVFVGSAGGRERYDGGSGDDTVSYFASAEGVTASLLLGYGSGGDAAQDLYTSIEGLTGSAHADRLTGDHGDNRLRGLAGDDVIFGNGGMDRIEGGRGDDRIDGGAGSDYVRFAGDAGEFEITRTGTRDAVVRWIGPGAGEGTDTLTDVEYLVFDDATFDIWSL